MRGAACVGVLLVCDPADPESLRDADGWLLRLRQAVVPEVSLLLAHKHDRARARLDAHALDAYCAHRGVLGWRATTALHGRSINAAVATLLQRVALHSAAAPNGPGSVGKRVLVTCYRPIAMPARPPAHESDGSLTTCGL